MENKKKRIPEWRKETRVGLIVTLSAALFFGGIIAIASSDRPSSTTTTGGGNTTISINDTSGDDPVVIVKDPLEEKLERPYKATSISIGRYFYDMEDDLETRSQALVPIPGKANAYMKSLGVDYVSNSQFNVYATCSGVVNEKVNDSVYGNMIMITHPTGIVTIYHSLSSISVNKGDTIEQDQQIGISGTSTYNAGFTNSVHFEIKKQTTNLNPEKLFSKLIKEF